MFSFESRVRYSETDHTGHLSALSLLDYFQDAAIFHSEDRGIGLDFLSNSNLAWVLSSWQIDTFDMPYLGTNIVIETYPYEFKAFLGYRNFVLRSKSGHKYAVANSIWSLINTQTGKPAMITENLIHSFGYGKKLDMEYKAGRLREPREESPIIMTPIKIENHNIDTNGHVNNAQYVALASDFIDGTIKCIRAEYKSQALLGDVLIPHLYNNTDKTILVFKSEEGKVYCIVEFSI